jgi:hypothetical protein
MAATFHLPTAPAGLVLTPEQVIEIANRRAAEATTTYLVGRGLAAEIGDLRGAGETTVPAPGLAELVRSLDRAVTTAAVKADVVFTLLHGGDPSEVGADVVAAVRALDERTGAARRTVRRIAQLLLGVSSQLAGTDAVQRSERAAVMVLHPVDEEPGRLVADGIELRATTDAGLLTELCGTLCRMIVDHRCVLDLRVGDARVQLRVDAVGDLTAVSTGTGAAPERLADLGWTVDTDGDGLASWSDPLTVMEPAHLAIETLQLVTDGGAVAARLVAAVSASAG